MPSPSNLLAEELSQQLGQSFAARRRTLPSSRRELCHVPNGLALPAVTLPVTSPTESRDHELVLARGTKMMASDATGMEVPSDE
jgi:hypothetical protein